MYEQTLFQKLPELEEIMSMIGVFNQPNFLQQKGLYEMLEVFRVNESIEKAEIEDDATSANPSEDGKNQMSKFLVAMSELHR